MSNSFIYGLIDPRTEEIRYIGKSTNPNRRLMHHLGPKALEPNTHKNNWIKSLLEIQLKPILKIICKCKVKNENRMERYYITYYKNRGNKLTNGTSGGDGWSGGKKAIITDKRLKSYEKRGKAVILRHIKNGEELFFNKVVEAAKFLKTDVRNLSMILTKKPEHISVKGYYVRYAYEEFKEPSSYKRRRKVIAKEIATGKIKEYESIYSTRLDGFDHGAVGDMCSGREPYRSQHKGWTFTYGK